MSKVNQNIYQKNIYLLIVLFLFEIFESLKTLLIY